MRKADVIKKIAKESGIPKADILASLESFFQIIKDTVANGEGVYIRGFGSFIPKQRRKKFGRDIQRNITIEIPERRIPVFKPAKEFVIKVIKAHSKDSKKGKF